MKLFKLFSMLAVAFVMTATSAHAERTAFGETGGHYCEVSAARAPQKKEANSGEKQEIKQEQRKQESVQTSPAAIAT